MPIGSIANKNAFVFFILFLLSSMRVFTFGAGIFYPRLFFTFDNIDNNFYWGAADKACELATEKTLLVPFKVKTFKGRYISPFAGL